MTNADVFKINHEINQRLAEMVTGDAEIRRCRQKDVMELVTQLCVEVVNKNEKPSNDLDVLY